MPDERFPLRFASLAHGRIGWREAGRAGKAPALVLLHGIGSGAASWEAQLARFGATRRVLAWDAPGYGESAPLTHDRPLAADYAAALSQWLACAEVDELVLVGHSLGALVAAAWAAQATARLHALVLASPARGYGREAEAVRDAKWHERTEAIERLGAAGMAAARAAHLCSPQAGAEVVERVRWNMARTTPRGYGQAAHMLAHDDLATHLTRLARPRVPMSVLCGSLDRITPPEACAALAREAGAPYWEIDGAAHACYIEQPAAFDAALASVLENMR